MTFDRKKLLLGISVKPMCLKISVDKITIIFIKIIS